MLSLFEYCPEVTSTALSGTSGHGWHSYTDPLLVALCESAI